MGDFQISVYEAIKETRDAATEVTAHYSEEIAREGIAVTCISGDGNEELGRLFRSP